MSKTLRAYISSPYANLTRFRKAAYDTLRKLGYDAIAMEDYVAADVAPLDKVRADVRSCDLYIGILGFNYGSIPKGEQISFTECEFNEATNAGITRLMFFLSPAAPVRQDEKDEDDTNILRFRKNIAEGNILVSDFENHFQLGLLLSIAVRKWEIENKIREQPQALSELKFPEEIRIKNYIPDKMLSVKTSFPTGQMVFRIIFMTIWFGGVGSILLLTIWNLLHSKPANLVGIVFPLIMLGLGYHFFLSKGQRIDFDFESGKAAIYTLGAAAKLPANPNEFKIEIKAQGNKFQATLKYGLHIIAKSAWFDNRKKAAEYFGPFTTALQAELGLDAVRVV